MPITTKGSLGGLSADEAASEVDNADISFYVGYGALVDSRTHATPTITPYS